jgi:hypothetical protein
MPLLLLLLCYVGPLLANFGKMFSMQDSPPSEEATDIVYCGHIICGNNGVKSHFKKCSRCKKVYYCKFTVVVC